jgi:ABC-type multidrug transport system fused ATPase/permease subunit
MKEKDARIKLVTEVLNGIKVLKLYAWEESFEKQILEIREREVCLRFLVFITDPVWNVFLKIRSMKLQLRQLQKAARLEAISAFNWFISPHLVAVCSFAAFVLTSPENVLDAEKTFVAISLLNILRYPLTKLPFTVTLLVQVGF